MVCSKVGDYKISRRDFLVYTKEKFSYIHGTVIESLLTIKKESKYFGLTKHKCQQSNYRIHKQILSLRFTPGVKQ